MSDSDLTPEQDDAVRALLASARHTEPAPPEVVARLDDALASLRAERLEVRAPVITLASRRRRLASRALLAAAVVVVGGVGITQVLPDVTGSSSSDDSGATSAEAPASAQDDAAGGDQEFGDQSERSTATDEKQDDSDAQAQESAPAPSPSALAAPQDLSSDGLKSQLRAIRRDQAPSAFSASPSCDLPAAATGTIVSVTFDGLPGALVYRAPIGSTQQVDVYLCGEPDAVRSLRLRAPR